MGSCCRTGGCWDTARTRATTAKPLALRPREAAAAAGWRGLWRTHPAMQMVESGPSRMEW